MRFYIPLILGASLCLTATSFAAGDDDFEKLDAKEFFTITTSSWESLGSPPNGGFGAGKGVHFLPLNELIRGQSEISVDNVKAKMHSALADDDIDWKNNKKYWKLKHDHGKSATELADPIAVIKGPTGYAIVDGHHDVFLSLYTGASTVAADVREDLSHLTPLEFWTHLKTKNLLYLKESPSELVVKPPVMNLVKDNPNRYLSALLAFKVSVKNKDGALKVLQSKGAAVPVWIKVNDGIPFMEFHIAKVLSGSGISYDPAWKDSVPPAVVEEARQALLAAKASGANPVLQEIAIPQSLAEAVDVVKNVSSLEGLLKRDCLQSFQALMAL